VIRLSSHTKKGHPKAAPVTIIATSAAPPPPHRQAWCRSTRSRRPASARGKPRHEPTPSRTAIRRVERTAGHGDVALNARDIDFVTGASRVVTADECAIPSRPSPAERCRSWTRRPWIGPPRSDRGSACGTARAASRCADHQCGIANGSKPAHRATSDFVTQGNG